MTTRWRVNTRLSKFQLQFTAGKLDTRLEQNSAEWRAPAGYSFRPFSAPLDGMEGVQVKKEKANMQRDSSRSLEYHMDCSVVLDNFHHDIIALGVLFKDQKVTLQASATCCWCPSCHGIRDERMSCERQREREDRRILWIMRHGRRNKNSNWAPNSSLLPRILNSHVSNGMTAWGIQEDAILACLEAAALALDTKIFL